MKTIGRFSLVSMTFILALTLLSPAQDHEPSHWGYEGAQGPSHWGTLSPDFALCGSGHHQSPIDIENTQKAELAAIQVGYKPSPLHIIDNGHTIMINYAWELHPRRRQAVRFKAIPLSSAQRGANQRKVLRDGGALGACR